MKERLIILSDLWGKQKSEWVNTYIDMLSENYDIKFYDCCELGEINISDYREEKLHEAFINGGLERAVENLIRLEKKKVNILAFSIGGTIAWKYGLISEKIDSLICLSSTRLRKEIIKPKGEISLYFGEEDKFKPNEEWLKKMELNYEIIKNKEHEFYKNYAQNLKLI